MTELLLALFALPWQHSRRRKGPGLVAFEGWAPTQSWEVATGRGERTTYHATART